jgi:type II secretory pathway component PulK
MKHIKGSILILSVWALSFLSLLAFFSGVYVRQQILAVKRIEQRKKARNFAKSAALFAIERLASDDDFFENRLLHRPAIFKNIRFQNGSASIQYKEFDYETHKYQIKYGIMDEERKININYADLETIKNMLVSIGKMEEREAFILANRIVDWRDSDDFKNITEAEESETIDYLKEGYAYTPKNSSFTIIEELQLVLGVDSELFLKIKDYVTVFTDGKVNINTANKQVLMALGLEDKLVQKIIDYRAGPRAIGGDGDNNLFNSSGMIVEDLAEYVDLTKAEKAQIQKLIDCNLLTCDSAFFSGKSISKLDNANVYGKIMFVFDRMGEIYYWSSNL